MDNNKEFSYWKKPWLKYLTLTLGVLQFPLLYGKIKDCNQVVHADIFSPEELNKYLMQQKFSFTVSIVVAVGFLIVFLIGEIAKSKRTSQLAEALLLIGIATILSIATVLWGQSFQNAAWLLRIAALLLLWGTGLFRLFQYIGKSKS